MSDYSEGNDFEDILERLLSKISDDIDKRQGSIIYDALAPAAAELAQCYIALDVFVDQTYLLNAVGENLDNRVSDYGLTRQKSTYAQRIITIYDTNSQLMDVYIVTMNWKSLLLVKLLEGYNKMPIKFTFHTGYQSVDSR